MERRPSHLFIWLFDCWRSVVGGAAAAAAAAAAVWGVVWSECEDVTQDCSSVAGK